MTYYLEYTEKELILRKIFFQKKIIYLNIIKFIYSRKLQGHEYPLAQSEKKKHI